MESRRIDKYVFDGIGMIEERFFPRKASEKRIYISKRYVEHSMPQYLENLKRLSRTRPVIEVDDNCAEEHYALEEAKSVIENEKINSFYVDLLLNARNFYEINAIFPLIYRIDSFTQSQVNSVISFALNSLTFKRSFEAQTHMFEFVSINMKKMDSGLFHRVRTEFPYASYDGMIPWVKIISNKSRNSKGD